MAETPPEQVAAPATPAPDRTGAPGRPTPPAATDGKVCRCGHGKTAHEHYRRGADCSLCSCTRFHRRRWASLRLIGR